MSAAGRRVGSQAALPTASGASLLSPKALASATGHGAPAAQWPAAMCPEAEAAQRRDRLQDDASVAGRRGAGRPARRELPNRGSSRVHGRSTFTPAWLRRSGRRGPTCAHLRR